MKEKLWLSEAINKYNKRFEKGKITVINSGAGSGKSHFIYNELINNLDKYLIDFNGNYGGILYVTDTTTLKDAIITEVENFDYNDARIEVITYAKFGAIIKNMGSFKYQVIILDEYQNLYNYCAKYDYHKNTKEFDGYYYNVISKLEHLCKNRWVIGLSATDWDIYKFTSRSDIKVAVENISLFSKKERRTIKDYNFNAVYTNNLFNFIKTFNWKKCDKKVLINTTTIKQMEIYKEYFKTIGVKAEWICSVNAKEKIEDENGNIIDIPKMSEEQIKLRYELIQGENRGYFPKDLQVLIVNSAYETGWNIKDEDVQIVLVDNTDDNYCIQARNRVRHNIETLIILSTHYAKSWYEDDDDYYVLDKDKYGEYNDYNFKLLEDGRFIKITDFSDVKLDIDKKFINVKLTKNEIIYLYGIKKLDKKYQYHKIPWVGVKEHLERNGYIITNDKKQNYYISEKIKTESDNKLIRDVNSLIYWFDNEWDKKRVSINDVRDELDIGVKSWQKVMDSSILNNYMKTNRITKTKIKGLGNTLYFKKY